MNKQEQRELAEILELAKLTEQKAKELCNFTLEIDQKYEKCLAQYKITEKLKLAGLS